VNKSFHICAMTCNYTERKRTNMSDVLRHLKRLLKL